MIAALMAAAQNTEESRYKTTIGERLALILERMGPAETKLGQVLHSSPHTPHEIRDGMGRLKSEADVLTRWDLFKLHGDVIPDSLKKRIKRVKRILGAASYYVTYEVELETVRPNGDIVRENRVISLLRPHAKKRAKTGFEVMKRMAQKQAEKNPAFKVLVSMIEQAERMADIETDWQIGKKQAEDAERLYHGATIQIGDGKPFEIHVARTLETGEGYRVMEEAKGVHFNDLPERTAKQKARKRDIARAYVALEISRILRGEKFDHDRHGAQLKIDGNKIYLFDFGAMATDDQLPTTEDRKVLAEVLYEGLKSFKSELGTGDHAFGDYLFKLIQDKTEKGGASDYLIRVQKGVIALGDFFKYLKPGDLEDVVKGVIQEGQVHSDIVLELMPRVMTDMTKGDSMFDMGSCNNAYVRIKN
ncbi:MAG: AarF/UbiB family protein [Bdellovibrionota bacterium]